MFIRDLNFQVEFTTFAESHFCKDFYKKYKDKKWVETRKTIEDTLKRIYGVQQTALVDILKYFQDDGIGFFKLDFRVAGTDVSPKTCGNRVIFHLCNNTGVIRILLVYGKDHIERRLGETQWIFQQIKNNFPEYKKYC